VAIHPAALCNCPLIDDAGIIIISAVIKILEGKRLSQFKLILYSNRGKYQNFDLCGEELYSLFIKY